MISAVYFCDGCRLVETGCDSPAPCFLVMHNGEVPKRCVCGKGAETSWRELTRTGTGASAGERVPEAGGRVPVRVHRRLRPRHVERAREALPQARQDPRRSEALRQDLLDGPLADHGRGCQGVHPLPPRSGAQGHVDIPRPVRHQQPVRVREREPLRDPRPLEVSAALLQEAEEAAPGPGEGGFRKDLGDSQLPHGEVRPLPRPQLRHGHGGDLRGTEDAGGPARQGRQPVQRPHDAALGPCEGDEHLRGGEDGAAPSRSEADPDPLARHPEALRVEVPLPVAGRRIPGRQQHDCCPSQGERRGRSRFRFQDVPQDVRPVPRGRGAGDGQGRGDPRPFLGQDDRGELRKAARRPRGQRGSQNVDGRRGTPTPRPSHFKIRRF